MVESSQSNQNPTSNPINNPNQVSSSGKASKLEDIPKENYMIVEVKIKKKKKQSQGTMQAATIEMAEPKEKSELEKKTKKTQTDL